MKTDQYTKANFGCGSKPKKGYLNVDFIKMPGVDFICNLNKLPYPFKTGQFDEILIEHTLEHLDDVVEVMQELWRISKPGGIIKIAVPYYASQLSFKDLTHKHFFTYYAFDNWDIVNDERKHYVTTMGKKMRFRHRRRKIYIYKPSASVKSELTNVILYPFQRFIDVFPTFYERFLFFYLPALEIYYELEVVK